MACGWPWKHTWNTAGLWNQSTQSSVPQLPKGGNILEMTLNLPVHKCHMILMCPGCHCWGNTIKYPGMGVVWALQEIQGQVRWDWWCDHVRATPSYIPEWALCRLYKKSGSGEMIVWLWSGMIRNSKGQLVEIGVSHQIRWNILSVRATPSNIQKQALCGLYKNSGLGEMRLMVWSWSVMISNGKGVVGWDRCISPNILREHNWGVPSAHIKFIYYVTYILEYLIMLWGHMCPGMYTILYLHMWELLFLWLVWEHLESHLGSTGQK